MVDDGSAGETPAQRVDRLDAQVVGLLAVARRLLAAVPVPQRYEAQLQLGADLDALYAVMLNDEELQSEHALRGLENLAEALGSPLNGLHRRAR